MSTLRANQIQTTTGKPLLNSTGSILQVVSGNGTIGSSTTALFPNYQPTGLTASITPTSVNSKILVIVTASVQNDVATGGVFGVIAKNGSTLHNYGVLVEFNGAGNTVCCSALSYLDSPATTSSTTYSYSQCVYNTGTAYFITGTIQLLEVTG